MSDTKLKPCPFCGGEARMQHYRNGDCAIECIECYGKTHRSATEDLAIRRWNTRKPMDRIVEQLENELELAEKQKEECTFKALPYYDRTEGYIVAMSNAINIVKGDDENE